VINAFVKKTRNIILIAIMCFSLNGNTVAEVKPHENDFLKDVIIEIIGIDNTVVDFFEFIFNNN